MPEPWDLLPAAREPQAPAVTVRQEPALPTLSAPSAPAADDRDLVRIRRAVLSLAAEGWNDGRIASQLSLGEEDVARIVNTAGAEPWSQPAGRGR
jgi:DNA-binding NarL/FixJ family response regulator